MHTEVSEKGDSVTKLIVRNLSPSMTVEHLDRLFANFGVVRSVSLATDIMTGRCGGFGHVHLDEEEAGAALYALNGMDFGGRVLSVIVEQKRFPAPRQN